MKSKILLIILMSTLLIFLIMGCAEEDFNILSGRGVTADQQVLSKSGYLYCFSLDGKTIFSGSVKDFSVDKRQSVGGSNTYSSYIYWFDAEGNFYQWSGPYLFTTNPTFKLQTGENNKS